LAALPFQHDGPTLGKAEFALFHWGKNLVLQSTFFLLNFYFKSVALVGGEDTLSGRKMPNRAGAKKAKSKPEGLLFLFSHIFQNSHLFFISKRAIR
jgi:hypothetical protein